MGVLDNGVHWYIETNTEPADRAVLRLAIDAGSILEDEDQLGLAHFVEHMAFNGTRHFPGNELITYLESVGTRFGPHLNAHTNFEETVYKLTVPTDNSDLFDKSFLVLSDWASGLTFDDEEIDKERGVVLEEWRTRLGPRERISEQTMPALYAGSPYPDRMPIGTEESLKGFTPDAARRFYQDWYRPDLMAVIAVGDFDPDDVQAKIEEHFSGLEMPTEPRPRPEFDIPAHEDVKRVIFADPEWTGSSVTVHSKVDLPQNQTRGDSRTSLLRSLAYRILNERLTEIVRSPDAPFLRAGGGEGRWTPTEGSQFTWATVPDTTLLEGYEALLTEVERMRRHGVRPGELQRAKANERKYYAKAVLEKDKTDSQRHADEIVRVFLTQESMPGIEAEAELVEAYVPTFTVEEVSAWLDQGWMAETSRVVVALLPEKEGLQAPTDAQLAEVEARVAAAEIPPLPAEVEVGPLLASLPEPGSIAQVDETLVEELDFTGWTLSNGVQVWFRKTDFKEDEVLFGAYSDGGRSRVPDEEYLDARLANAVVAQSGYGEHDVNAISKWVAGRSFSISPRLSNTWETLNGRSSVEDLEPTLQLVYAAVVAPRFSEDALELVRQRDIEAVRNRYQNPDTHFNDAYNELVWPTDPRYRPWTVEGLEAVDLETIKRIYRDHFMDASGWTFVFVGNLPDNFQALVERYLASLPAEKPDVTFVDRGYRPTEGRIETVVNKGLEPRARVRLEYRTNLETDIEFRNHLGSMGDVLAVQLREKLREDLGGVYGVSVSANGYYRSWWHTVVSIRFTCDPDRVDELVKETEAIVARLRTEGPEADEVLDVQEKNRRSREVSLRKNSFWKNAFRNSLQWGESPLNMLTWDERNDALTPERVREVAATVMPRDGRTKVVLLPAPTSEETD